MVLCMNQIPTHIRMTVDCIYIYIKEKIQTKFGVIIGISIHASASNLLEITHEISIIISF